jgi:hypothetical protein
MFMLRNFAFGFLRSFATLSVMGNLVQISLTPGLVRCIATKELVVGREELNTLAADIDIVTDCRQCAQRELSTLFAQT